jgi:hypothetical protein
MKNLKFILPAAMILMTSTAGTIQAQVAMSDSRNLSETETGFISRHESSSVGATNQKAANSFKKDYAMATSAQWSVFTDNSLMCRFYLNGILHRAFYTPHGNWIYTASGYGGSKLDKAVAESVKTVYYDFRIVYADQIDLVNGKTFYIVEIQNEKSIRKLRVNENEMEVIQEFAKP